MVRLSLIRRLEAVEQLVESRPVALTRERELRTAMAADPVLTAIATGLRQKGYPEPRFLFDPKTGRQVFSGPRLAIADIDLDDSETVLLRTEAIRTRLEGNPDGTG